MLTIHVFLNNNAWFTFCFSSPILLPLLEVDFTVNSIVDGVLNDEETIYVPKTLLPLMILKQYVLFTDISFRGGRYIFMELTEVLNNRENFDLDLLLTNQMAFIFRVCKRG